MGGFFVDRQALVLEFSKAIYFDGQVKIIVDYKLNSGYGYDSDTRDEYKAERKNHVFEFEYE